MAQYLYGPVEISLDQFPHVVQRVVRKILISNVQCFCYVERDFCGSVVCSLYQFVHGLQRITLGMPVLTKVCHPQLGLGFSSHVVSGLSRFIHGLGGFRPNTFVSTI